MEDKEEKKGPDIVEKVTFVFGLIVLIGLVSFLIFQMYEKGNNPPELEVSIRPQPQMEHYGFKVEVENKGEQTAQAAQIVLSLFQEGKLTEEGTVQFQYVPVKSKQTSWIVFYTEEKPGDSLVVSSVTFVKP